LDPAEIFGTIRGETDSACGEDLAATLVNGDTVLDLRVGAPNVDAGFGEQSGAAYLLRGPLSGVLHGECVA
jgi:hypothetical protein